MANILRTGFFVISIIICAIISYFQATFKMPFDISPTFFLMIIISIKYGFPQSIIFVIISSIIPAIIAGGEVGLPSFLFLGSFAFQSFLSNIINLDIIYLGIILSTLNLTLGYFINKIVGWEGGFVNSLVNYFANIIYFLQFGSFLMGFL
ncbi:MAG: hypothetical protein N3D75_01335 [Candidatus Aenigmarchaeota archaeon]|nr:hypothetical protein [Candidatus Aenigmarchaeota archaeon]